MYKVFLSLRYLRSRTLSIIAIAGMGIGVFALVTVLSVMGGFQREFWERIRGTQAHVTVDSDIFYGLRDPARVAAEIGAASPLVVHCAPYIENICIVRGPIGKGPNARESSLGGATKDWATIKGIVLADEIATSLFKTNLMSERAVMRLLIKEQIDQLVAWEKAQGTSIPPDEKLTPERIERIIEKRTGNLPDTIDVDHIFKGSKSDLPGAVVGIELFRHFGLRFGDVVSVLTTSDVLKDIRDVESRERLFEVTGVVKSGIYEPNDRRFIYCDLPVAQDFILGPGNHERVTGINVKLRDYRDADAARDVIQKALDTPENAPLALRAATWAQKNRNLYQAVQMEKWLLWFILLFMILVAGFNIFCILSMSVVEKTRDLGIVKAVGGTTSGVLSLFLSQGILIGALGSGTGIVLGLALAGNINQVADFIHLLTGYHPFPANIYYLDRIPVQVDLIEIACVVAPTVLCSTICALYPAYRAARLDPVEALRQE